MTKEEWEDFLEFLEDRYEELEDEEKEIEGWIEQWGIKNNPDMVRVHGEMRKIEGQVKVAKKNIDLLS